MKPNYLKSKENGVVRYAIGIVCAILIGVVLLFFAPIFIINEYIDESLLGWIAAGVHLFASFVASCVCAIGRGGGIKNAIISVLTWFLLSVFSGILLFNSASDHILTIAIACTMGCLFGLLIGYLHKNPHKSKRKWKGGR